MNHAESITSFDDLCPLLYHVMIQSPEGLSRILNALAVPSTIVVLF